MPTVLSAWLFSLLGVGMVRFARVNTSFIPAITITVLYGLLTRLLFGLRDLSDLLGVLTVGFIFSAPFGLGALTVLLAPQKYKTSWSYSIFAPWVSCIILVVVVALTGWEAWICVVMALPILLLLSSLGGALLCLIFKRSDASKNTNNYLLFFFVLSPYLLTPLEHQFVRPAALRTVERQILVEAGPDVVWQQIIRVPRLAEHEHRSSFFRLAGLPRPLEATLKDERLGGVRTGIYENGLQFIETITAWEPQRRLMLAIKPKTDGVFGSSLPLQEIGGTYFDVLEVGYTIEPLGEDRVLLRLSTTHQLSTHFNWYGGLWTDYVMGDIQSYILDVVKARAERASLNG